MPDDLRDGEWHYVVASYLPGLTGAYTINGVETQAAEQQRHRQASMWITSWWHRRSNVSNAYLATNINDTALLLPNNAGGVIDQFALYNKALLPAPPLPGKCQWCSGLNRPSNDALSHPQAAGLSSYSRYPQSRCN